MKYRILGLLGVMALTAGSLLAQDYDDIYYDASKAPKTTKVKVETPVKTVAVYGEVPEKYKVVVKDNYREERDVDEYNRRGAYEPQYEIDINGDTIYMDSTYVDDDLFANTRRIERFYNPDVVILSDDDDLVELYYDESPTINLIVGSDWGYSSYGWASSYYPWYTGWYSPWYIRYYDPWYYSPWHYGWYSPYHYGYWDSFYWGWNHRPWWSYNDWYWSGGHWGWPGGHHYADWGTHHPGGGNHYVGNHMYTDHRRGGLAPNRNTRPRVDASGSRNQVAARGTGSSRSSGVGMPGSRNRSGGVTSRSGNMGSRNSSGVSTRSSGASRASSSGSYGGSRSSGSYGGSRSSGSYSGGSSSRSSGSYSGGSSSRSSGSYSSGSSGGSRSSGGGSHGGSSGGGGRRH